MSEPLLAYNTTTTDTYQMNTINPSANFLDTISNSRTNELTLKHSGGSSTPTLFQSTSDTVLDRSQQEVSFNNNKNDSISTTYSSKTLSMRSHQSSKSFGSLNKSISFNQNINQKINITMIKSCPNMLYHKCQCKDILKQNKSLQKIWCACYRINISNTNYKYDNRAIELAYFDGLYAKLSEYFQSEVYTNRVVTKQDMLTSIKYFGAFEINNDDIIIDRCNFIVFWQWFRGVTNIIKDLYNLWDTKFPFQLNLLMNRQECDQILQNAPRGTFVLRLSHSQINGLVLSYSGSTFNRVTKIKNLLLIRQSEDNYVTRTNNKSHKSCCLNQLIRAFVKLKYVYTPNYIYKKNHIF